MAYNVYGTPTRPSPYPSPIIWVISSRNTSPVYFKNHNHTSPSPSAALRRSQELHYALKPRPQEPRAPYPPHQEGAVADAGPGRLTRRAITLRKNVRPWFREVTWLSPSRSLRLFSEANSCCNSCEDTGNKNKGEGGITNICFQYQA